MEPSGVKWGDCLCPPYAPQLFYPCVSCDEAHFIYTAQVNSRREDAVDTLNRKGIRLGTTSGLRRRWITLADRERFPGSETRTRAGCESIQGAR